MIPEWDSLPEDIWASVFQRVDEDDFDAISRTCKLFLSITDRSRTTLTISNETVAFGILRRCRNIKRVNVHPSMRGDLDCLIREISTSGVAIEALDLSDQKQSFPSSSFREAGEGTLGRALKILICKSIHWTLMDQDLVTISEAFLALELLDIRYAGRNVTDAGIEALASKLAHLRKINLSGCCGISDASLFALSSNCASLSEVHLSECSRLRGDAMTSFIAQKLKLISFSVCSRFGFPSFAGGKALQCLKISQSYLSDGNLLSIAESRLPLRELRLLYCRGFSVSGFDLLLQAYPSLSRVNFKGIDILTDETMAREAPHLREVTTIDLSDCSKLTDLTFMCLIKCCPLLEELRMKRTDLGRHCLLGSASMKNKSKIRTLDISGNRRFNDETLTQISSICPELRTVDLSWSYRLTDVGITCLGLNCPLIRTLDVSYCRGVTNLGDEGFNGLETLRVRASRIKDDGLLKALPRCRERLRVVDLVETKVTRYGVMKVMEGCSRLREIGVSGAELRKLLLCKGWERMRRDMNLYTYHGKVDR
ncbi:hypothetical protein QJS04_geneDACA003773 [Acorus gramineus]|uniref:F-box domain-containing protein n=1 Tax=Acorus gramineus TaxID=55184 RepID=A0AAV9BJV4_ACOGR|nr:hypothetical protein QJS04_geneDACA003773 [Acorus gramineus]